MSTFSILAQDATDRPPLVEKKGYFLDEFFPFIYWGYDFISILISGTVCRNFGVLGTNNAGSGAFPHI